MSRHCEGPALCDDCYKKAVGSQMNSQQHCLPNALCPTCLANKRAGRTQAPIPMQRVATMPARPVPTRSDLPSDQDMCHHIHISVDPAMIDPPEHTRCARDTEFVVRDRDDPYSETYLCETCLPGLIHPNGSLVFPYAAETRS